MSRKRFGAMLTAVALLLPQGLALAARAASQPIAIVAALQGKVEVIPASGGPPQRATLGRSLERGDKVQVGAGGKASLFFRDGNLIEVGEKSAVTVGGRVSQQGRAVELSGEVFTGVSTGTKFITGGSRQTGLVMLSPMRGAGESQVPLLISPRRTDLMVDRPVFTWRAVEGASRYRVTVSDSDGELWKREVERPSLPYPSDRPALKPGGDYLWEVVALSDRGALRNEDSMFHVLSAAAADTVRDHLKRIDQALGESRGDVARYLAGSYLLGRGLYCDAAERFEALCKMTPEAPGAHEALGNAYQAVGLADLAAAEFQRALTLSREAP